MTSPPPIEQCTTCGHPLNDHEQDVRFRLPSPVIDLPDREATTGTWMSHDDPNTSVMMQVPGAGPFCRSLLPVHLDGGYTLHLGVWVSVHPDDLQRTFAVWWEPAYADLELDGVLANSLPGWDLLGAPVHLAVRNVDHTPYIVASPDEALREVLQRRWPHEQVLSLLPQQRPAP